AAVKSDTNCVINMAPPTSVRTAAMARSVSMGTREFGMMNMEFGTGQGPQTGFRTMEQRQQTNPKSKKPRAKIQEKNQRARQTPRELVVSRGSLRYTYAPLASKWPTRTRLPPESRRGVQSSRFSRTRWSFAPSARVESYMISTGVVRRWFSL